ncbi:MAG: flagellar hook-associated protein 3 [candidate division Zixibacteria bacterium 4484_95]|nr:MAG: flagellar hook-associated protein 3 [candidate division Zixibacteria bacterium 4484_95]RKX21063.1 MAG: flagellar hook-associated protein 3 [candidate division Zixibacteria bacterium]
MRVTNKMVTDTVVRNLSQTTKRYLQLQSAISSGRRINKPSDDPLGITKDLNFRSRLSDISQFNLNITHSISWMSYSDSALDDINGLIIEAKDLAVQLANDTYDENARIAGATQVGEMFNQILDAVNSQYLNSYIFGGSKTNIPPILANDIGVIYQGDYQDIMMETERNSYLKINTFASEFTTRPVKVLGEGFDLNPGLQPNLWLSDLNGGQGVNMGAGQIVINTLNGRFVADISAAKNIQQVLNTVNNLGIPNFTASISGGGSGLQIDDTSDHELTVNTPLALLNNGAGVSQEPGTFVVRTEDSSIVVNIDISADENLGDVINNINLSLAGAGLNNVTVSIDTTGNRLIIDDSNPIPYSLVIEEGGPNQTTAADLGIIGTMEGYLEGKELEPLQIMIEESADGETIAKDLGLLKGTEFETLIGEDINPELKYFTKLSSLNSNAGIMLGVIRITNGLDYVDIDLSGLQDDPNATILDLVDMINRSGIYVKASLNSDRTGIAVESLYDDRSLMITEADSGSTALSLGIFGSPDILGNMLVLEKSLSRNNTEEIQACLDVFDLALDQLLTVRSSLGSRIIRAETSQVRMLDQDLQVTDQLSQIEDADMVRLISELASAEAVYQSSLATAARVIQPSLMDFLR